MMIFFNLIDLADEQSKFSSLYSKYKNLVIWIALNKLQNNMELAEECLQETFLYVARNFEKIGEIDSASTKSYVATIAQAYAIKIYYKENKFNNVEFVLSTDTDMDNNFGLDSFEIIELKTAFEKLSDREKSILWLKYVYGYKSKEIAEVYEITDSLVRKIIQNAKNKVKKYMQGEE